MAKLRHIAIQVPDLQKAAKFYEDCFDLKRVAEVEAPIGNAISLSDGVVNLTLLHFPEGTKGGKGGPDWAGLHHFGFVVEDGKATEDIVRMGVAHVPEGRGTFTGLTVEENLKLAFHTRSRQAARRDLELVFE